MKLGRCLQTPDRDPHLLTTNLQLFLEIAVLWKSKCPVSKLSLFFKETGEEAKCQMAVVASRDTGPRAVPLRRPTSSRDLGGHAAPRASGRRQAGTERRGVGGGTSAGRMRGAARSQGGRCPAADREKRGREQAQGTWKVGGQAHAWSALVPGAPNTVPRAPPFTQELTCMQLTLSLAQLDSDSTAPGHTAHEKQTAPRTFPTARRPQQWLFSLLLQEDDPMAAEPLTVHAAGSAAPVGMCVTYMT